MDITILGRLPYKDPSTLFPVNDRSRPFSSFFPKDVHSLFDKAKNQTNIHSLLTKSQNLHEIW
jgi:hypothetical protein